MYLIFIWKKPPDHWNSGVTIEEIKCLFSLNFAYDQVIKVQDADDLEFI